MKKIIFSKHFRRVFKKISNTQKINFEKKYKFFCKDIFHPQLKTHKLKGLKNCWSFSLNFSLRVIFRLEGEKVFFLEIGSHDIYK